MRNSAFVLLLFLAGCPESRSPTTDGGVLGTDAPVLADAPSVADAPAATDAPLGTDAPDLGDVVLQSTVARLGGRTLWVRVFDNAVGVGTPWRRVEVGADGFLEERFVDGMPADVFGVFVDVFLDEGDEVCTDDPAYRLFASNDFGAEITVIFSANPDEATTCAELGW